MLPKRPIRRYEEGTNIMRPWRRAGDTASSIWPGAAILSPQRGSTVSQYLVGCRAAKAAFVLLAHRKQKSCKSASSIADQ